MRKITNQRWFFFPAVSVLFIYTAIAKYNGGGQDSGIPVSANTLLIAGIAASLGTLMYFVNFIFNNKKLDYASIGVFSISFITILISLVLQGTQY